MNTPTRGSVTRARSMTVTLVTLGFLIGTNLAASLLASSLTDAEIAKQALATTPLTRDSLKLAATQFKWSPEQVKLLQADIDAVTAAQQKLTAAQVSLTPDQAKLRSSQDQIKALQNTLGAAQAKLSADQQMAAAMQEKQKSMTPVAQASLIPAAQTRIADLGARDPANFPRPQGLVRLTYNSNIVPTQARESATYSSTAGYDDLVVRYTESLSAAGWMESSRSESGDTPERLMSIIHWHKSQSVAEVRIYGAKTGSEASVTVTTDRTAKK